MSLRLLNYQWPKKVNSTLHHNKTTQTNDSQQIKLMRYLQKKNEVSKTRCKCRIHSY